MLYTDESDGRHLRSVHRSTLKRGHSKIVSVEDGSDVYLLFIL